MTVALLQDRLRILFVVPYVPTRIRVRPYFLLKGLVERGHDVTLATVWSNGQEREQLAILEQLGVRIVAMPLPRLRSLANCVRALPTATPLQAVYSWQPALAQQLLPLVEAGRFDMVHVEHLRGAQYGLALAGKGVPVVWDSVDCISHLFEQASQHSRTVFGQLMTRLELGRTRAYEGWLVNRFDTVLVTSTQDEQALARCCELQGASQERTPIRVLPNGVDSTFFTPNGHEPDPETLVFSGKMSYHANITMALYMVQEVMPHIWAERPTVRMEIVGQNPPPAVKKLANDARISVTGFVPDLLPYLQRATVAVVPALYATGIQNKVLEAMACGVPVVATPPAVQALNLTPGRDIFVAEGAAAFARQVLRLLGDAPLRQSAGARGLDYVRLHHAWPQVVADLEAIYQSVMAPHEERASIPASSL